MNKVSLAILGASASALSFVSHAGIKIEKEEDKISDSELSKVMNTLNSHDCESVVDFTDLASALSEDGKIDGVNIESILASDQGNQASASGYASASCCHGNCHTNCHSNCHGSRSWR